MFTGVRFWLYLPVTVNGQQHQGPFLHRPGDDDSGAVTFWGKHALRKSLVEALRLLDEHDAKKASTPAVESSQGKGDINT